MSEFLKHCQENPEMACLEVKIEELESQIKAANERIADTEGQAKIWQEAAEVQERLNKQLIDGIYATKTVKELTEKIEKLEMVRVAAEGLRHGTDWNNGTHAKLYRAKLCEALLAARSDEKALEGLR